MRKTVFPLVMALGSLLAGTSAHASSSAAWADLRIKSDKACLRAADLRDGRVSAYSPDFQAVTVSTVEGVSRARADRGARYSLTCVYDKRSGQAQAFELKRR